jgi:hypothetical protein
VVALEGDGDAVGDQRSEFDEGAVGVAAALTELACFEHLLHGGKEAVGIGEHDLVELLPLGFGEFAALQGFEIEADGGDGGLEFVGDGVEEGVLALVAPHFTDQEDGVENNAGGEQGEDDNAQNQDRSLSLVQDDPAELERDGGAEREYAEGDKEGNGSAASGDVHAMEKV